MATHRESRRLPYSADELFDLVADVARYPEFLPWCSEARILSREAKSEQEVMVADLTISFKIHKERFRSEVTLDKARRIISTRFIEGPFKHLSNEWRFTPDGDDAAMVDFFIEFEFKNRTLQMLIGLLFEEAVKRLVGAFEARARVLYGRRRIASGAG